MTSTVNAEIPEFPMARAAERPFDPPPALQALQRETPLTKVRLDTGRTAWLVTRYADQRAVLASSQVSVEPHRPGFPHMGESAAAHSESHGEGGESGSTLGFIMMDDPEHARLRRMVTAPFTIKRVEAMRPAVQQIVDRLIDDLLTGPNPVDLVEAFALPVPSLVISELLGVPYEDHEFFQNNSKTIIRRSATMQERGAASQALAGYLYQLLGQKIDHPADDVLSGLAARVRAGELPQQEAAKMGVLLLLAGHETTANMIALGTAALLQHPDQLALLRDTDDPKLVAGAVEELLRYLHITHGGMRRVALADIEVAGQTVKAGEGLIMANEVGDRDPAVFENPDTLDLTRDARHHVAFSFGVHQCLGQPLARMELQVVYSTLYKRIPTLKLATTLDQVPFKHDGFVYGVYELPVTW